MGMGGCAGRRKCGKRRCFFRLAMDFVNELSGPLCLELEVGKARPPVDTCGSAWRRPRLLVWVEVMAGDPRVRGSAACARPGRMQIGLREIQCMPRTLMHRGGPGS